jgi:hypothetical protein
VIDFTKQLTDALQEYSKTSETGIQSAIDDVCKEARKKLSSTSPTGHRKKYKRGWKVTIVERPGYYKAHIHNRQYQLTHLLEKGHKTNLKSGKYGKQSRSSARPHIRSVEQWAIKEVEKRIKEVLQG